MHGVTVYVRKRDYGLTQFRIFRVFIFRMFHHQDWEPVVIRKPVSPKPPPQNPPKQVGTDPEDKKIKVYSKELGDAIVRGRCTLKISQTELAKRCNVVPGVIQEMESHKGLYNPELVNKVLKVLKLSFTERRFN